jgi:lactate permease
MFTQILDPTGNLFATWLIALIPVVALLILLAVLRMPAWLATLIGSIITFVLALGLWRMPAADGVAAYLYGSPPVSGTWTGLPFGA